MENNGKELIRQRDFKVQWLEELDAKAAAPNEGWPVTSSKDRMPEFRDICRKNGLSEIAEAPQSIHEFDLFRQLLGDYTPAKDARRTAARVRRELQDIEACIAMLQRNGEL